MTFGGVKLPGDSSIRKSVPKNSDETDYFHCNNNAEHHVKETKTSDKHSEDNQSPERILVWRSIILIGSLHIFSLIGAYLFLTWQISVSTFIFGLFYGIMSSFGITAGAHRLWAHRCYKARLPLRIFLAFWNSVALQNSIYVWVRDHRVHHKFTETHADPHNAKNGFFFAHMGWLMVKKHEDVKVKGKTVDMSDLEADPVVMFQKKYYVILSVMVSMIIPTLITWLYGPDPFFFCWCMVLVRYALSLHCTWLVNSAAHFWGHKPYDGSINPTEGKIVAILSSGEGWHNYHHVFPWDYKAAELGNYRFNPTTAFIDLCAYFGLAYDLKTVSKSMIHARVERTGDGTYEY